MRLITEEVLSVIQRNQTKRQKKRRQFEQGGRAESGPKKKEEAQILEILTRTNEC